MKLEKVTKPEKPAAKRSYDDACAAAHALDLIGERWSLLVMRELMFGPKRFSDLRADLPGVSANVLTQRLEGLEEAGILRKTKLPPPASVQVYELTEWGYESEPILQTLGRWAARSPKHDPNLPISTASFLLSLRTMMDHNRSLGMRAVIGLRLDGEDFTARLDDEGIRIERGIAQKYDLHFESSPRMLAAAIYGGQPLSALETANVLKVIGDRALAEKFVTLFPLPDKAPAPE
ncbi:winged helix-turn-helix transcriptional regulator [Brucella pecoris]|uniref:DNA-binding HxlR family transcriptional regulator n=1 Tax=Brucella pecoris TaxID=867683 RepID=A0A5C5CUA1_9HYPH|nr:helix-turn-helix domain-containing protein [Brucella pecoris]MBB4092878.1 DNA-binding HxlR family transcriptional regulator [Brucella pecoris]TNV14685.1 helix-turn-helix transcriptional regulator [Brucella pecoris]